MKKVCGVGINDADYLVEIRQELPKCDGKRVRKYLWQCPYYTCWRSMLSRCYGGQGRTTRNRNYLNCAVCEEWLTFSNFKSWMQQQDWQGKQLDKDILGDGKLYSPETCCFVSNTLNSFLLDCGNDGNKLIGAFKIKNKNKYVAKCSNPYTKKCEHLGTFDTELQAHRAWVERKSELAVQLVQGEDREKLLNKILQIIKRNYTDAK